MKLSFMVAGVQKGGTTALHHFLSQHPQIFLPKQKELHFFDNEKLDWTSPDYESYHQHFSGAPTQCLCGEATPIYTYWRPSLARIYRYNPNLKLIISLRHPIERAYSHWRMESSRNFDTMSFSQAVRDGRSRVTNKAEIADCHRVFSYIERGFYSEQLKRVFSYFHKNQVLLVQQNQLRHQHIESLDKICSFLGIRPFSSYPPAEEIFTHKNHNTIPVSDEDMALLNKIYESEITALKTIYGVDFQSLANTASLPDSDIEPFVQSS